MKIYSKTQLLNVILSTLKSVITIKGGKTMSKKIIKGVVKVAIALIALGAGVELGKRGLADCKN